MIKIVLAFMLAILLLTALGEPLACSQGGNMDPQARTEILMARESRHMKLIWDWFAIAVPGSPDFWNNSGMMCTDDDVYAFIAEGVLDAHESFTQSKLLIANWVPHLAGIKGTGRNNFEVSISFIPVDPTLQSLSFGVRAPGIINWPQLGPDPWAQPPGTTQPWYPGNPVYTSPPVFELDRRVAVACCGSPEYHPLNSLLLPIPNTSTRGVVTLVSWTITNTTNRKQDLALKGHFTRHNPEDQAYFTACAWPVTEYGNCVGHDPRFCYTANW